MITSELQLYLVTIVLFMAKKGHLAYQRGGLAVRDDIAEKLLNNDSGRRPPFYGESYFIIMVFVKLNWIIPFSIWPSIVWNLTFKLFSPSLKSVTLTQYRTPDINLDIVSFLETF